MTKEERAEEYVRNKADKGNFDLEQFGKAYFSESSLKQAFIAGLKAGREERIKEIAKEYPDFGKGVGYKMSMVDELDTKKKHIAIGMHFGKTGLLYHTIVNSLPVSAEKKKELHERYEKALRGEL